MLAHIKKEWVKATTHERHQALVIYTVPWDQITNIRTYKRALTKAQDKCRKIGIKCDDSGKVQHYVEQMYATDIFEDVGKRNNILWNNLPQTPHFQQRHERTVRRIRKRQHHCIIWILQQWMEECDGRSSKTQFTPHNQHNAHQSHHCNHCITQGRIG